MYASTCHVPQRTQKLLDPGSKIPAPRHSGTCSASFLGARPSNAFVIAIFFKLVSLFHSWTRVGQHHLIPPFWATVVKTWVFQRHWEDLVWENGLLTIVKVNINLKRGSNKISAGRYTLNSQSQKIILLLYTTLTLGNEKTKRSITCKQLYAWTSANSGGSGVLGCLLSKCCLKVLGSGICV